MWQRKVIAGFVEAEKSERTDRAIAFTDFLPEVIAGEKCVPLTPQRMEWLRAYGNPYIVGGVATLFHAVQFLWLVSPDFKEGEEAFSQFMEAKKGMNMESVGAEIDEYLDRAFLDAPNGTNSGPSYYAMAASLIYEMAQEPFRWPMEKTMTTKLSLIYQLMKCNDRNQGAHVVNRRSGKVAGDWLDEVNVVTETTKEKLQARIEEMERDGFVQMSDISPNARTETDEKGITTIIVNQAATWSVAMRKVAERTQD